MNVLRELAKDGSLVRLVELRQLKGKQAFTNNEGAARFVAGSNGYVVEVEIPDEAGEKYYRNQAIMQIDGKNVPVDHFGIPGNELFRHKKEWHVNIHDIKDEKRREGRLFRTIRQETDLSQRDRDALGVLRNLPSGGEKK